MSGIPRASRSSRGCAFSRDAPALSSPSRRPLLAIGPQERPACVYLLGSAAAGGFARENSVVPWFPGSRRHLSSRAALSSSDRQPSFLVLLFLPLLCRGVALLSLPGMIARRAFPSREIHEATLYDVITPRLGTDGREIRSGLGPD